MFLFSMSRKKSLKIPKGNLNPYTEEGQTIQWANEFDQKDKTLHRKLKIEQYEPHYNGV